MTTKIVAILLTVRYILPYDKKSNIEINSKLFFGNFWSSLLEVYAYFDSRSKFQFQGHAELWGRCGINSVILWKSWILCLWLSQLGLDMGVWTPRLIRNQTLYVPRPNSYNLVEKVVTKPDFATGISRCSNPTSKYRGTTYHVT